MTHGSFVAILIIHEKYIYYMMLCKFIFRLNNLLS